MKNVFFAIVLFLIGIVAALFVQKHTSWFTPSNVEYEDSLWFSEQLEKQLPIVQKKLASFSDVHDVITYRHERECKLGAEYTFLQMTNQQIINTASVILRSKPCCTIEEIVQEYNSYRHVYDGLPKETTIYKELPDEDKKAKNNPPFRQHPDSACRHNPDGIITIKKDTTCGR